MLFRSGRLRRLRAVADIYLGDRAKAPQPAGPRAAELAAAAGLYRSTLNGETVAIGGARNALGNRQWTFAGNRATATDEHGQVEIYERVTIARPSADTLGSYVGRYSSDEAETELVAAVEKGGLVLHRRPDATIPLAPLYADAFSGPQIGTIIFRRDASGQVNALSVVQERVWDLRFQKTP